MKNAWIDSYYEALEFFYWEPQHLGRKKYDKAEFNSLSKVQKHLRNMEVTLNHNIQQFLSLAPASFRNVMFERLFSRAIEGEFVLDGRDVDAKYKLVNATQPDILFTTSKTTVSIEMKVGAKSTLTQVLKYALLALAVEQIDGVKRLHFLGLLGPGDFSRQWKEGFSSVSDLRHSIEEVDKDTFLKKQPLHFREHSARYREILSALTVGFMNYEDFAAVITDCGPDPEDVSTGAEVYRNLIGGMIKELKLRQLVQ